MITPTLKFENSSVEDVFNIIRSAFEAKLTDPEPIIDDGIKFYRFDCTKANAQATGSIIIQPNEPEHVYVTFSIDLRRIWKIWSIPKDQKLVHEIEKHLCEQGGIDIDID